MQKRNRIIYWIATVWLVLGMVSTGIVQVYTMPAGQGGADMMVHLGYPLYILYFLGVCKLAGSIIIIVPKLPLLKEWAYAGFFFVMLGAIFSHIASGDVFTSILPALLLLVLTITSWYLRPTERKLTLVTQ